MPMESPGQLRSMQTSLGRGPFGFTLLELLVVIAIIAVLSTLMVPAVRGLVGVGGRRGGMNTLASTIEKARLAAIENGVPTYVGFPFTSADPVAAYSAFIVFRDKKESETNAAAFVPLSQWVRLPPGVFVDQIDGLDTKPGAGLPKLALSNSVAEVPQISVMTFDRFGKLKSGEAVEIRVGEKPEPKPEGGFLKNEENCFLLKVRPLTGRVTVQDLSTNAP